MQITDDKKVEILLTLWREKHEAAHKMRERSQSFALWVLGAGLTLGWILLNGSPWPLGKNIALTAMIFVLWKTASGFIKCIEKGFDNNKDVMVKAEEALGFYAKDMYFQGDSLLPQDYKTACCKETSHFCSLSKWLNVVAVLLAVIIWRQELVNILKNIVCKT